MARAKKPEVVLGPNGPYFKLAAVKRPDGCVAILSVAGSVEDVREARRLNEEIERLPRTEFQREAIEAAHAYLVPLGFGPMDPRHWFERARPKEGTG